MLHRWLLPCLLLLNPGTSLSADVDGKFAMKGAGFLPCQVLVTERQKKSRTYYLIAGWLEGYIAAHNRYSVDTFDILSFESLELLLNVMQLHCKAHPNDRLHAVLGSMITRLSQDRLTSESAKVAIEDGGRSTQLYRETIRRMQSALSRRGYYKDAADGRYTDAVRSALLAFQSDNELEMTGFPDQTTLWRLLRK